MNQHGNMKKHESMLDVNFHKLEMRAIDSKKWIFVEDFAEIAKLRKIEQHQLTNESKHSFLNAFYEKFFHIAYF